MKDSNMDAATIQFAGHSALLHMPSDSTALMVLAHGAGAGMDHWFMAGIAAQLAALNIATLRFNFPFTAAGRKRPDSAVICEQSIRSVCAEAATQWPRLPLFAGGKSMGGRMTTQAEAALPLPHVGAIVLLGFPLHRAKLPGTQRAVHLRQVTKPMLFVQGTRDALTDLPLLQAELAHNGHACIYVIDQADHGFAVPKRTGLSQHDVLSNIATAVAAFVGIQVASPSSGRSLKR
jgi:uncharacterized protein